MTNVEICNLALSRIGDQRIVALSDATPEGEYCTLFYDQTLEEVLRVHFWNFAMDRAALRLPWNALVGVALSDNGAGLIRVVHVAHELQTGNRVTMELVEGVIGATGSWLVSRIDADTIDLQESAFSGAHVSGTGRWIKSPLFGWQFEYALPANFIRLKQLNAYESTQQPTKWEIEGGKLLTDESEADIHYVRKDPPSTLFDALFIEAFSLKLASKLAKPLTGSGDMAQGFLVEYTRITAPLAQRIDAAEGAPDVKPPWVTSDLVASRFNSDIG